MSSDLTLEKFLPYRLSVVAAVISQALARTYSTRFGINIPEWRVMATVGEFRSVTAKAIGQHAYMSKVKVSRAAAALAARDLIAREANTDDLREAFIVLTPKGKAMYEEIVPLALDYVRQLTSAFSSHERAALDEAIDKLLSQVQAMESVAGPNVIQSEL